MIENLIFTIALFSIIAYIVARVLSDIAKGVLIFIVFLIAYFIAFKTMPSLSSVPLIGNFEKTLNSSHKSFFNLDRFLYKMQIVSVDHSGNGQLTIVVENTGLLPLSNFTLYVNGKKMNITDNLPEKIYPKKYAILQTWYNGSIKQIKIVADHAVASLR